MEHKNMSPRFIDEVEIEIKSGSGGNGLCSFAHTFRKPKAGPDGGDGGSGGNVVFVGNAQMDTLLDYKYKKHFKAKNGGSGGKNLKTGARGEDCTIEVPLGTRITVTTDDGEIIEGEILEHGQKFIALKGGKGGRGNAAFKSSRKPAPRECEEGESGKTAKARLSLHLIADVGIIGAPNSGKSTLLNALTGAKSKCADYPFTTLHPHLGVAEYEEKRITLADLPGLVEGAAKGVGLGLRFLRHAERTKVFCHVVDASLPPTQAAETYRAVRTELKEYGKDLIKRPEIVAANKIDKISEDHLKEVERELENAGAERIISISAMNKTGLKELVKLLIEKTGEKN